MLKPLHSPNFPKGNERDLSCSGSKERAYIQLFAHLQQKSNLKHQQKVAGEPGPIIYSF